MRVIAAWINGPAPPVGKPSCDIDTRTCLRIIGLMETCSGFSTISCRIGSIPPRRMGHRNVALNQNAAASIAATRQATTVNATISTTHTA